MTDFISKRLENIDRNYFINGDMRYFQRCGTNGSFNTQTAPYTSADRFKTFASSFVGPLTEGAQTVGNPEKFERSIQIAGENAAISSITVGQAIESVFAKDLDGEELSFKFWFKTAIYQQATVQVLEPSLQDNYGAAPVIYQQIFNIENDDTWRNISIEQFLPAGTTVRGIEVRVTFFDVASFGSNVEQLRTTGWQLNKGKLKEFSLFGRDEADELDYCRRYFEKSYDIDVSLGASDADGQMVHQGAFSGGNGGNLPVNFKTRKRGKPVVIPYATDGTTGRVTVNAGTVVASSISIGENSATVNMDIGFNWFFMQFQWSADVEI